MKCLFVCKLLFESGIHAILSIALCGIHSIFALNSYHAFETAVQPAVVRGVNGQVEVVVPGQDVATPPAITMTWS